MRDVDYLETKAYLLEYGTRSEFRNARQCRDFPQFAMIALQQIVPRGHHYSTSLKTIYEDLLDAYWIAQRAKPITMDNMTFGEWCVWYEKNVMPTLNSKKVQS